MSGEGGRRDILNDAVAAVRSETGAGDRLLPLVYQELRRLARGYLAGGRNSLQPTELVHEAYLKLAVSRRSGIRGRTHFFRVAALAMRQIIVDQARRRKAAKRGGDWQRVTLTNLEIAGPHTEVDLAVLSDALDRLARLHERQARVVEMRIFAGLTVPEVATALAVHPSTVETDWAMARAWLSRELRASSPPAAP